MFRKIATFIFGILLLLTLCGNAARDVRTPLPVLMYHHIRTYPKYLGAYVVSPETFENDLKWLSDHGYQTVSAADLVSFCKGESELPPKPCMLTFDDGQESFLRYAVPLLEKYNMCAVMHVVGSYADYYTENPDHTVGYSYLDWSQVAELSRTPGVEMGVHTQNMHSVDQGRKGCRINPGESRQDYSAALTDDLAAVESRFEEHGAASPTVFAYPFGYYCAEAQEILTARGYTVAFTCEEKVNMLSGDAAELMTLGRYNRGESLDRERLFRYMGMS